MLWVKKKMSYPMMNVLAGIGIAPFPVLFFGDAVRYFTTVGIELVLAMAFGEALLRIVARHYRNRPKVVRAPLPSACHCGGGRASHGSRRRSRLTGSR